MFVGHFGVALAGKKTAERPSLGTLFMASYMGLHSAHFDRGVSYIWH